MRAIRLLGHETTAVERGDSADAIRHRYASKGNYTRAIADATKAGELAAKVMPTRGATLPTKSATTAPKAVTPPPQSLDKASSNKA
jgi:hypothetical protein